ncbi:MAG: hypothetical protein ACHREM_08425 [Polyangiales bacterium]
MTTDSPDAPPSTTAAPPNSLEPTTTPTGGATTKTSIPPARVDSLRRRLKLAVLVYAICTLVFSALAGDRVRVHTVNNHFAVQAELWSHGRWYLTEPEITARARRGELDMNNDWAIVRRIDPTTHALETRYFNSFPSFPALLMWPLVAIAGAAVNFQDAMFVVGLAGIGPALLFLALERLRLDGRSPRSERENVALSFLFAFGTVYFFSAVQGTVWFAAHVVAVGLSCGYLLASFSALSAPMCLLAGVLTGCGVHTRPPFLLCVSLFAFEAARRSLTADVRVDGSLVERARDAWSKLDRGALFGRYVVFSIPIVAALALNLWINQRRFGDPFEFGHTLLNVAWMERVKRWGLFSVHYLSRNLTCAFTLLPSINPATAPAHVGRVQVSGNGLALWVTTPLFLWLLWPKKKGPLHLALWVTAGAIAWLDFTYQNSGWLQFGYRFSNDFSPYLVALLAVGGRSMGVMWKGCAAWAIAINAWGAGTFQRRGYEKYYFQQTYSVPLYDGTSSLQQTTYAPD